MQIGVTAFALNRYKPCTTQLIKFLIMKGDSKMGRIAMVTRTINSTKVTTLTVDVTAQATATQVFSLSGTFADNDKLIKALKKEYETDNIKIVSVISSEVEEQLFGMTEQEFMSLAKVLPPRKTYGNTEEIETTEEVNERLEQAKETGKKGNKKRGK